VKTLFAVSALAEVLMLLALYLAGRKHVLAGLRRPYGGPAGLDREPNTALIIPVTGDTPAMRSGLSSLLAQDYPNLRYVLVTRDDADPATSLVRELIKGRGDAAQLTGGPALLCGQKNQNLLAGVAHARDWAEIYVFCDSTHLARPDLIRLLVDPIAKGQAPISGGYHRVVPLDSAVPTLGMLNVSMVLHSLQSIRTITQPWGGAMAISREAFERYGVAAVWAENIVDDFSLGPLLAKQGIRSWPVAEACLETPLANVPWSHWREWLTRQLLYLKFCTPEMWLGSLVVIWLFSVPPFLAALGGMGALTGLAEGWWLAAALVYAAAFCAVALVFRTLSPRPVGAWAWVKGFFATPLMTAWCYLLTWTTFTMSWRGIAYRVTWGGRVVEVLRGDS
jgi:cellulose synthase/poly-beta-1,6-N-acetylglucosamine synthase-like glycosyltransferase